MYYACMLSHVSYVSATLWAATCQAPLSMILQTRILEWVARCSSGLPCPPGDLPDPGIKPASPALAGGFFITSTTWETSYTMKPKQMGTDDGVVREKVTQHLGKNPRTPTSRIPR